MGNVTVGHSHSITTSQSSSDETGRVRRASGPAVRYNAKVEFELVVEKSGKTLPTITPMSRPVVLRTLADNEKLAIDGNPASAAGGDSAASNLDATEGLPGNALAWQLMGHGALPPSASVEAFRGVGDVRDAAVRALTNAGANTGITGAGTGAKNSLWSGLNTEMLEAKLPGMLDGALNVPGLHEATLLLSQHADVKVYARVVNPKLAGISDGIDLEMPESAASSTTTEFRHNQTRDASLGIGAGSLTDTNPAAGFNSRGLDVRRVNQTGNSSSSGVNDSRTTTLKPKGRTGLVGFDVEYRVVADLGGGKMGVVELKVPDSVRVRMTGPDAESVLGNGSLPDALTKAQNDVKSTADAWRTAEGAVDKAQRAADDLWLQQQDARRELAQLDQTLATANAAVDTLRQQEQRNQDIDLRKEALADAWDSAEAAGRKERDQAEVVAGLRARAAQIRDAANASTDSGERTRLVQEHGRAVEELAKAWNSQVQSMREHTEARDRAIRIGQALDNARTARDNAETMTRADLGAHRKQADDIQRQVQQDRDAAAAKAQDLRDPGRRL
jgi:hypothetical protein